MTPMTREPIKTNIRPGPVSTRSDDIIFGLLEHLRGIYRRQNPGSDWKDVDDILFSELDLTRSELLRVYKNRGVPVFTDSAVPDTDGPKNP